MATVTQIQREVALLVEREPRNVWVFAPMRETALLNDTATVTPNVVEREVAQLGETASPKVIPRLRDVALLDDVLSGSVKRTRLLREVAQLKSRALSGVRLTDTLREVAELNDSVDFDFSVVLRDPALLDDAAYPRTLARTNMREVARLKSRAVVPIAVTVREVAQLDDLVLQRVKAKATERDTALLDDEATNRAMYRVVLRDTALLDDMVSSGGSTAIETLRDVAYLSDDAILPSQKRAYTCSIVNWGMSTFSNFAFSTMAGNFAAGANLWRLDADDDYGTPITSYIKTGVLDMGSDHAKRLSAVYAAGYSDAPLTLLVTGDVNGAKEEYEYEMELRDQEDYRNNRALVGKGFRSRFVQFQIQATAVKYKLLSAEADVSVTARRV